ncbi:MAG TPA: DegV family protein [Gaiellaceae bacterium]
MRKTAKQTKTLDGHQLFEALLSGLHMVQRKQDYLNKINVYPVPDGDTGTNITATLSYALETAEVTDSAGETMSSIADAALVGARGNSGIIFAQFLSGLSEAMRGAQNVAKEHFVHAAENARLRAYEAVTRPKEGTMLTVMRAWAEALHREADSAQSIAELLRKAGPALADSLEKTRDMLPQLKAAGVVDAGASGFVEFIAGAERFINGKVKAPFLARRMGSHKLSLGDKLELHESGEVRFRYCTEALITGQAIDREALRSNLEPFGDSLIVAGASEQVRIHIHTDQPAQVFASLTSTGRVVQQKVDDMLLQYEVAHRRKYPIAIVTDSTCDLPRELIDQYQIQIVPLHIIAGENEYLDKLTIDSEEFFNLADHSPQFPTSSQPSSGLFTRIFSYLSTYYDSIIAIHVGGGISGTVSTSAQAAKSLDGAKKISVIDSRNISGALGLIVLRAAEAVAAGKSHDEVVSEVESCVPKAQILVSVRTLEYFVKGGRIKPMAGALGKLLNLKPIVSVDDEGRPIRFGKAFSERRNVAKIVSMVARRHAESPLRCYAVVHGHDLEAGEYLAEQLEEELGFPPFFIEEIAPVLALHAGRGTTAVVSMQE